MAETSLNQYHPSVVTPPGKTLQETIDALGFSQAELAMRIGLARKTVNDIIFGLAPITPDTAIKLENAVGVPAHFWLNGERYYRESLARSKEREALQVRVDWMSQFPLSHAIKLGWLERKPQKVEQLKTLLQFFGVASPDEWAAVWEQPEVAWRRSHMGTLNVPAISMWLRQGEILAQSIKTSDFDTTAFRKALKRIRQGLTSDPAVFVPMITRECGDSGVAVVFVSEITGSRTYGAVKWLTPNKALIQLSLRGKTDDQLWFSFFHEAAHLFQNHKRDTLLELSDRGSSNQSKDEAEADEFARDILIDHGYWNEFIDEGSFNAMSISSFAHEKNIPAGVVVGRLQHEKRVPFKSNLNKLKVGLEFV